MDQSQSQASPTFTLPFTSPPTSGPANPFQSLAAVPNPFAKLSPVAAIVQPAVQLSTTSPTTSSPPSSTSSPPSSTPSPPVMSFAAQASAIATATVPPATAFSRFEAFYNARAQSPVFTPPVSPPPQQPMEFGPRATHHRHKIRSTSKTSNPGPAVPLDQLRESALAGDVHATREFLSMEDDVAVASEVLTAVLHGKFPIYTMVDIFAVYYHSRYRNQISMAYIIDLLECMNCLTEQCDRVIPFCESILQQTPIVLYGPFLTRLVAEALRLLSVSLLQCAIDHGYEIADTIFFDFAIAKIDANAGPKCLVEFIQILQRMGGHVNIIRDASLLMPIHVSAMNRNVVVLLGLMASGADLSARTADFETVSSLLTMTPGGVPPQLLKLMPANEDKLLELTTRRENIPEPAPLQCDGEVLSCDEAHYIRTGSGGAQGYATVHKQTHTIVFHPSGETVFPTNQHQTFIGFDQRYRYFYSDCRLIRVDKDAKQEELTLSQRVYSAILTSTGEHVLAVLRSKRRIVAVQTDTWTVIRLLALPSVDEKSCFESVSADAKYALDVTPGHGYVIEEFYS